MGPQDIIRIIILHIPIGLNPNISSLVPLEVAYFTVVSLVFCGNFFTVPLDYKVSMKIVNIFSPSPGKVNNTPRLFALRIC